MTRTFLITKLAAVAFADMPNDIDTDLPVAPPTAPVPLTLLPITDALADPTTSVRWSVLNSFLSSLNLQLITRCRSAITERGQERDADADSDKLSIDERNDADDAAGANGGCYSRGTLAEANAAYQGNPLPVRASTIARHLACIRAFAHIQQEDLKLSNATPYVPRSLWESIDFLRSQMPTNILPSDPAIRVAAQLTGQSAEVCARVRNQGMADERARLELVAPEMVAMGDDLTGHYEPDAQEVENSFSALPGHIQVNLYACVVNAYATAYNSAFKKLLTRGNILAAGDMTIALAQQRRALLTHNMLVTKHATALGEFESIGGQLKELKLITPPAILA